MKFERRLSRHQLQVLRAVADGRARYRWSSEWQCWERFYERWNSPQQGEKVWENHFVVGMSWWKDLVDEEITKLPFQVRRVPPGSAEYVGLARG